MTKNDYWGDILGTEPVDSPVRILQEQSDLLGHKTGNQLVGTVSTQAFQKRLRTTLAVTVPDLDNYRFDLVSVYHTYDYYPLVISDDLSKKRRRCQSESEFRKALEAILSSEKTRKRLQRVLAAASNRKSQSSYT